MARLKPCRRRMRLAFVALVIACLPTTIALAQLPVTQLESVFPAGGQAGSTFEATISGGILEDVDALVFTHPGIRAEATRTKPDEFTDEEQVVLGKFQVQIADDVPPDTYAVRAAGRYGLSNPRAFEVSGRITLRDNGSNRSPGQAQAMQLGATVDGQVDKNSTDYYQIELSAGQTVVVDCRAQRIDSRLHPAITVADLKGHQLASSGAWEQDPVFVFEAPRSEKYTIGIRDHVFDGGSNYVYRLDVHADPYVVSWLPLSAPIGTATQAQVFGWNLPGGKPADLDVDGVPLQSATWDVPAERQPPQPLKPRVPSAPYLVHGLERASTVMGPADQTVALFDSSLPVVLEEPGATQADSGQVLQLPCDVSGMFYPARDDDWYRFSAKKGEIWWIEVVSHRLGTLCDPYFVIQQIKQDDKEGSVSYADIAQVDDPSDRNGAIIGDFDLSTDDPSYQFNVPSDGEYRVMIRDQFGSSRSDARCVYRLVIRPLQPDFVVMAVPEQIKVANNNQVATFALSLRRSGCVPLKLLLRRREGFVGEVSVSAVDLPAGITCPPVTLGPSTSSGWLVFYASADAADWQGPVTLQAEATLGDQASRRPVFTGCVLRGTSNRQTEPPAFRPTRQVMLTVIPEAAPAAIIPGDASFETSLGGKLEIPVKVARREGYKENMKLVAVGLPKEMKPGDITVNGDKTDGKLAMSVTNSKIRPGVYSFWLRCDTKTKRSLNPDAITRAEAKQKHLDGVVKQAAEEVKSANTALDQANKQVATAKQQLGNAQQQLKSMQEQHKQAAAAAATAKQKAAQAADKAKADPDNAALQQARADADKAMNEAGQKVEQALAAMQEAETVQTARNEEAQQADTARAQAETDKKSLEEKQQRATALKKTADTLLATAKKNYAAKDVNIALISTPMLVRVTATPIHLTSVEVGDEVALEGSTSIKVALERKYGFNAPVDLTIEWPKGVAGLSTKKITIAADQADGQLDVAAAKNAKPGSYQATLKATGKFNNVNVTATQPVTVTVTANQ